MQVFLLNFILLGISSSQIIADNNGFCSTTVTCIEKIKKLVPDTNKFWFGDQYELQCGWNIHSRSRMVGFEIIFLITKLSSFSEKSNKLL